MADRYLLESSSTDGYLLEDGSGVLLVDAIVPNAGWDTTVNTSVVSYSPNEKTATNFGANGDYMVVSAATIGSTEKKYFEFVYTAKPGNSGFGVMGANGVTAGTWAGGQVGATEYDTLGNIWHNSANSGTQGASGKATAAAGDRFSVHVSGPDNKVWFAKWNGSAFVDQTGTVGGAGTGLDLTGLTWPVRAMGATGGIGDQHTLYSLTTDQVGTPTSGFTSLVDVSSGSAGTVASTEASDSVTASGSVATSGAVSGTEAADTASASGAGLVSGSLARTEASDTAAASGGPVAAGSVASTESADTASASGTVSNAAATGTVASTEAADTSSASGVVIASGSLARTEAGDTAALSGAVSVTGALSATEGADTASGAGSASVAASGALTEANDNAALTGAATVAGSIGRTEANDTASAAGAVGAVSGSAAIVESADTASASGVAGNTRFGTASLAEANDTASASGSALVAGAIASTEANDSAASAGSAALSGALSPTENADSAALAGAVTVSGLASLFEELDVAAASGTAAALARVGSAALVEANDNASAIGAVLVPAAVMPNRISSAGARDLDFAAEQSRQSSIAPTVNRTTQAARRRAA